MSSSLAASDVPVHATWSRERGCHEEVSGDLGAASGEDNVCGGQSPYNCRLFLASYPRTYGGGKFKNFSTTGAYF